MNREATYCSPDGALEVRIEAPPGGEAIDVELWERVSSARYSEPVDAEMRSSIAHRLIDERRPKLVDHPTPAGHAGRIGDGRQVVASYLNADGSLRVDVCAAGDYTVLQLIEVDCALVLYSVGVDGLTSNEDCAAMAQRMVYNQRPTTPRVLSDARAVDLIAAYLRMSDLDAVDFRQEIEQVVTMTGRDITTPGDFELWAR
jgi:hypothetical protein